MRLTSYKQVRDFWLNNPTKWFLPEGKERDEFDNLVYCLMQDLWKKEVNDFNNSENESDLQVGWGWLKILETKKLSLPSPYAPHTRNRPRPLNSEELVGKIILLDQITRHFARKEKQQGLGPMDEAVNILRLFKLTKYAVLFAKYMFDYEMDKSVTAEERVFILMPIKHYSVKLGYFVKKTSLPGSRYRQIYDYFILIKDKIEEYIDSDVDNSQIYFRFFQNTLKQFEPSLKFFLDINLFIPTSNGCFNANSKEEEYANNWSTFSEILEHNPKDSLTNFKFISKLDIVNIFKNFLQKLKTSSPDSMLHAQGQLPKYIIVSLSGGVDSMVTTYILANLQQRYDFKLVAVHINYSNRKTADAEENFIKTYCNLLNIDLYVRKIVEVKRGYVEREFYEEYTKNIRFQTYKDVSAKINQFDKHLIPVILGHNKDDIVVNIFNNIRDCRDMFSLNGMEEISNIYEVSIWRPLLFLDKKTIIHYAEKANIPYLINTTPEWSRRGRFRNIFLPALHEMYGEQFEDNIISLAQNIREYKEVITPSYDEFFMEVIELPEKKTFYFEYTKFITRGTHFWEYVLNKTLRQLGENYECNTSNINKHALKSILNLINSQSPPNGTLSSSDEIFNKTYTVPLKKNIYLIKKGIYMYLVNGDIKNARKIVGDRKS